MHDNSTGSCGKENEIAASCWSIPVFKSRKPQPEMSRAPVKGEVGKAFFSSWFRLEDLPDLSKALLQNTSPEVGKAGPSYKTSESN